MYDLEKESGSTSSSCQLLWYVTVNPIIPLVYVKNSIISEEYTKSNDISMVNLSFELYTVIQSILCSDSLITFFCGKITIIITIYNFKKIYWSKYFRKSW